MPLSSWAALALAVPEEVHSLNSLSAKWMRSDLSPTAACYGNALSLCPICVQLYKPEPFQLSVRVPVLLTTVFVTLMYSSGLPILLPFALIGMCVMYFVDKLSILKWFAKPPNMGSTLAEVQHSVFCPRCCLVYAFLLLVHAVDRVPATVRVHTALSVRGLDVWRRHEPPEWSC